MASDLDAFAIALMREAAAEKRQQVRTPSQNNPLQPVPLRAERRTQRSYSDPTGEQAIGNRKRKR